MHVYFLKFIRMKDEVSQVNMLIKCYHPDQTHPFFNDHGDVPARQFYLYNQTYDIIMQECKNKPITHRD